MSITPVGEKMLALRPLRRAVNYRKAGIKAVLRL